MKRILFAALAAASVSLLVSACGSDSDSGDTAATTSAAAADADTTDYTEVATTGDIYTDTCNGILGYIQTLQESGVTDETTTPEAIGEEFITLQQQGSEWAGMSEQDRSDFERAVHAAVDGSC